MKYYHHILTAVCVGLGMTGLTYADAIGVSNLGEVSDGSAPYNVQDYRAVEFITGSQSGVYLKYISFVNAGGPDPGDALVNGKLALFSYNGGIPGGSLMNMDIPSGSSNGETIRVDLLTPFEVTPNTSFFIVLYSTTIQNPAASLTSSDVESGMTGWTIGNELLTSDNQGTSWTTTAGSTLRMEVGVIPEPATVSLIGMAGISMVTIHRIKRRRNEAAGEE